MEMDTRFGPVAYILARTEPRIIYVPRHGKRHNVPPDMVNYPGIIRVLYNHAVRYVIATTVATRLNPSYQLWDIVIPSDVIDFTYGRKYLVEPGKIHYTDMARPFSERVRRVLAEEAREKGFRVHDWGTVIVAGGPRYETPAEARMYRGLGGDLISMTLMPEAAIARSLGLEYAAIAIIAHPAADEGSKNPLSVVEERIVAMQDRLRELILGVARRLVEEEREEKHRGG